ncbi:transglutaminase domain-containing protein [Corallococcus sp. CA054B]|uniref:transglutaminase-like domain-containing protein n=1 Tax=Corallococcus sp. CA054B TaxID=2316734 RepID=UPI000EA4005E|nr:transglutaminase-like domain-containing protein [Corallococcus sp. CA054B]RKG59177.1 transglutaminase domain-containing protein [Corallococcus sp. CA054B]
MAISSLSRPSSSPCAKPSPEAAQAPRNVVVKVVTPDGKPVKTVDSAKQPQEFAKLLKELGLTKEALLKGEGAKCQAPKPTGAQSFQQNRNRDSFEPSKAQAQKAQPAPAPTPAPAQAQGAKGPSSGKSADQVAQDIAKEATSWKYDYSGGKTWDAAMKNASTFDASKSGVCVDMAIEAEQRFEKAGVEARVVFGNTDRGAHAWVEFKDDKGQFQAFDPTAAACTKKADDAITPYDSGLYGYQGVTETHQAVG